MTVSKYSRSEMRSEFVFQLLNRIGPFEGSSRLIITSDEIQDGLLKLITAHKMARLEEFALEQTEPDLKLIEPGGIGREPNNCIVSFPSDFSASPCTHC